MAFKLFKKNNVADIIYMNGHISTNDEDYPWANAVACKDGVILAVGDYDAMEELTGNSTEIVDLNNQYMFPGLINIHSFPVLNTFQNKYFNIESIWDFDSILGNLTDYIDGHPGWNDDDDANQVYFGYGFNEASIEDKSREEIIEMLDEVEKDLPILLMSESGLNCIYNTVTKNIIAETAESECVPYLTASYIANIFSPFDYEETEVTIKEGLEDYAEKGFTSVFNLASPDYFDEAYQNSLLGVVTSSDIPVRFFGSLYINRPLEASYIIRKLLELKTNCVEISDTIKYNTLHIEITSDNFSASDIDEIFTSVSENGFNIFADCKDESSAKTVSDCFSNLRSKVAKNINFTLATDYNIELDAEDEDKYIKTFTTNTYNESIMANINNINELVELYTIKAASLLGLSKNLGSIEKDKWADFTVYEENILEFTLNKFSKTNSSMTIIGGELVHDAEGEAMDELFDLLSSQQI